MALSSVVWIVALLGIFLYYLRRIEEIPNPTVHLNSTYDYIIVGSGAAGSVLAGRLSEDSKLSILVVETGDTEHDPMYDIPWYAPNAQMTKADWMYYTEPQKHACLGMKEQRQYMPRGRGLGGSTILNGLVYIRGSRYDYDKWAENGCTGWNYDNILPYFKKMEDVRIAELKDSEYRSTGGPQIVSDTTISEVTEKWLKAGEELGYEVKDCNGANGWQKSFSRMQAIVGNSIRWHAARAYLWPAMRRPNIHVSVRSHVTKVLTEGDKAVGVEVIRDNRKLRLYAGKEVILSAGAINTPQILMLSGIGPKQHLQEMKIPVVKDLPVGNNLQDHVMFFIKADIKEKIAVTPDLINSWKTWLQYWIFGTGYLATNAAVESTAWLCTDPRDQNASYHCPDVEAIFFSSLAEHSDAYDHFNYKASVAKEIYGGIHTTKEMPHGFTVALETTHPKSRGTIRLTSKDPFDYPKIDVNYFEDPYDVKPIIGGVRLFQKLLKTKTMVDIGASLKTKKLSMCDKHQDDSDELWECLIRHLSVSGYHVTSTCRMGSKSDEVAVVDPELRVRGMKDLRIVDASVFPYITSGNTMVPTMMIAEKAADLIRGIDSVVHKGK